MSLIKRYFRLKREPDDSDTESSVPLLASDTKEAPKERRWKNLGGTQAWLVALAIFLINFFILGHGRVASILYIDFMKSFHVNRRMASAPYSVQQSVRMLFGPVVGILGQTFDVRTFAVVGCIIAAITCASAFFANGITMIIVTWGALFGIGAAFTSTLNLVLIEKYFKKCRSSASGVAFAGACVGGLIFPIILDNLIHKYSIRGNLLIMAGILLNVVPIALLLRLKPTSEDDSEEENRESRSKHKSYNSFDEHETSLDNDSKNNSSSEDEERLTDATIHDSYTDSKSKEVEPKDPKSLEVKAEVNVSTSKSSPVKSESKEITLDKSTPESQDAVTVSKPSEEQDAVQTETENVSSGGDRIVGITVDSKGVLPSSSVTVSSGTDTVQVQSALGTQSTLQETSAVANLSQGNGGGVRPKTKSVSSGGDRVTSITYESKGSIPSTSVTISSGTDTKVRLGSPKLESKTVRNIAEACKIVAEKPVVEVIEKKVGKTVEKVTYSKKSGKQKRTAQPEVYVIEKYQSVEPSSVETTSSLIYGHEINFNFLHENAEMVLDLLTNKIPIGDEEIMPSTNEITQNDLESPDIEFISQELQRVECQFQKSYEEVQQFLNTIKEKLEKFQQQLDVDRGQFQHQKKLNLDGKELNYKDIRNTTIRRSSCTIEIFEYTCEIPVELYIPIKLQELYERSSSHILTYYNNNERISRVLRQLRKLHEIFSGERSGYAKTKRESLLLESTTFSELTKSNAGMKQSEKSQRTFCKNIMTALKIQFNPMFFLICLCRCLHVLTFLTVITTVVDFAMDKGLTESQGIYAVAVLSSGDLIGRLSAGLLSDVTNISDATYMVIILVLQGILTASLTQARGITMVLLALLLFAIFQGMVFVKHSVILMKYLKKDEKSIGLGSLNFFPGLIGLFMPFYIGYTRDKLGSYDMMLYVNGGLSFFVGLMWLLEPYLRRFVPATREQEGI